MNTDRTETKPVSTHLIKDGPSVHRLLEHFEHVYDINVKVPVSFTVDPNQCFIVAGEVAHSLQRLDNFIIKMIEYESGSGYDFNLAGYCEATLRSSASGFARVCNRFEAFYNARTRTGTMKFF